MTTLRKLLLRHGVAIAATAAALYLRLLLNPALGHRLPFITLYAAIAVAVWFGGWQPGLLSAVLGYVGAYRMFVQSETDSPLDLGGAGGVTGLLVYLASGLIVIFLGNGMRIARRRAEVKEAELELITGTTPLLLTRCDRLRRFIWVNRACAEFLGRPAEEIVGRAVAEVLGDEAAAAIEPHVERVLRGETVEFEMEIPYAHPGRSFMHVIYTPDRDEGGEVIGWIGSIADVTRQRKAEAALRESELRFRVMADAAPVLIWTSGPDKLCTWFNKPWLDFTGRTMEQELGNGWSESVHPEDLERCVGTYVEAFDMRRGFSMEYRLRRHDGEYRWALGSGVPRYGDGNEFLGYIGSCIDITDRKRNEDALREADRRKDEFLATLAHELRNPLAPVRNAVEILRRKGPRVPELDLAREVIDRQMRQMARLIDDLMDVSRITRNRLELRRERVNLGAVLQSAVETSRGLLEASGSQLRISLPDDSIHLDADPTRLAQVFSNLLSNAAKFSEPGGRITLGVERLGGQAIVSVRDHGIGIPLDMQSRIFDVFVQVDSSLERAKGGLGIGLTLVKQLLEMHGGSIEVRSEGPGRGTEFIARIPVLPSGSTTKPGPEDAEAAGAGQSGRVLVADDNEDAAATLAQVLELLGYEVRIARDGLEAIDALEEFRPAVALLDIGMPKSNGYDVAKRARASSWGKEMILVAVTGWGQIEDKQRALEAGFDHHLVKPVDPSILASLLASLQRPKTESAR